MTDSVALEAYLAAPTNSFWRWEDGGQVVCWRDGTTIAFRTELLGVMHRLAPQGLPPLDAILLLLAATRSSWSNHAANSSWFWSLYAESVSLNRARGEHQAMVGEVLGQLDRLNLLAEDVRSTQRAREELADSVFAGAPHRLPTDLSAAIVRELESGWEAETTSDRWIGRPLALGEVLESLHGGFVRCTESSLRLRFRTGLLDLPAAPDLDIPLCDRVRNLLRELERDDEWQGLARVARQLLAVVAMPRRILDRDDLRLGGVSDIANRGEFDRLLVSELAYDDLTLAVRVAMNEALYLRREAPPRSPPRSRFILLDSGLRTWGVPRLFGTAVALALSAAADVRTGLGAFRANGDSLLPVDLATREGLVAHLESLTPDRHPGAALESLWRNAQAWASTDASADFILITTPDTLADAEFQRALGTLAPWPLQVATVERSGALKWLVWGPHGRKTIREAKLDLADLTPNATPVLVPDRSWASDDEWPAIFRSRPFPLRLPYVRDANRMWPIECGVVHVTRDRRLLLCEIPDRGQRARGAEQLHDQLPSSNLLWCRQEDHSDEFLVVVGQAQVGRLWLVRADRTHPACAVRSLSVRQSPVLGVTAHRNLLFVLGATRVDVLQLPSGDYCETIDLQGAVWSRDRFFRTPEGSWHALSSEGTAATLRPVFGADDARQGDIAVMFETRGIEGPLGLTRYGDLYFTSHQQMSLSPVDERGTAGEPTRARVELAGKSRCGRRIVVRVALASQADEWFHVTLGADPATTVWHRLNDNLVGPQGPGYGRLPCLDPDLERLPISPNTRRQFSRIGVIGQRHLALEGKRGGWFFVVLRGNEIHLHEYGRDPVPIRAIREFTDWRPNEAFGFTLKIAQWSNGSRAVLDSRGMLHLRGSPQVPETTLIFGGRQVSGWSDDGRAWGSPFFATDRASLADTSEVFRNVLVAFAQELNE